MRVWYVYKRRFMTCRKEKNGIIPTTALDADGRNAMDEPRNTMAMQNKKDKRSNQTPPTHPSST